ncbi:MAG: methyltransferase domain-containing protein [Chloroflexi bacterium]|nr:methyltransferase domain-containing protein [Chloroflexota bacterium]
MGDSPFRPEHFRRADETADDLFYSVPRLVTHIDDEAIAAATRFYGEMLPEGEPILDLMSSWVSHLPESKKYESVTGLGMNAEELAANPQLASFVVQDLNREPRLPFADRAFGGAVVTVSVQYLTSPVEVFREVGRVLRPGGPFIVTYSNRCFPTKAVAMWQALNSREHADLIAMYFQLSGAFGSPLACDLSPNPGRTDPLFAVMARAVGEAEEPTKPA